MFEQDVRLGPGAGNFSTHTWEILIMLLGAFLLGLMLGYILWSRYKQEAEKLRLDNASLNATAEALRVELADGKLKLATAENDLNNFAAQLTSLSRNNANLRERLNDLEENLDETLTRNRQVETELGLSLSEPSTVPDIPLEVELPNSSNVVIEQEAAEVPEDAIAIDLPMEDTGLAGMSGESIVQDSEIILPVIETSTDVQPLAEDHHVDQEVPSASDASEASAPDNQELSTSATTAPPPALSIVSTTEEPAAPKRKRSKTGAATDATAALVADDDLTVIEGIGPKIQMLLQQYGIRTYHQLADTDVVRLKEILAAAGPQLAMHDPGTWPSQANLAANDQWEALKSIQGFLKGGKPPEG